MLQNVRSLAGRKIVGGCRALVLTGAKVAIASATLFYFQAAVRAETGAFRVNLSPYAGESLSSLMSAAETLASSEVSRRFNQNAELSVVQVTVLGEYNGQVVPVLVVTVPREGWQRSRQIRQWASYFDSSYLLLGFNRSDAETDSSGTARDTRVSSPSPRPRISPATLNPVEELVQAAEDGEISDAELIELIDALD
ncbi:hypothetical protein [Sphaerothrix gracilis]|uniref:hypothetical protein n=1 Tax=Sphaerothrix gracilis TaxID=3151835 RepID=UPI0031FD6992